MKHTFLVLFDGDYDYEHCRAFPSLEKAKDYAMKTVHTEALDFDQADVFKILSTGRIKKIDFYDPQDRGDGFAYGWKDEREEYRRTPIESKAGSAENNPYVSPVKT